MTFEPRVVSQLELETVIGFNGHVFSGLKVHPDGEHLVYPLGSTVILRRIKDGSQEFLQGHTNNVSCISVSKSGAYIASGQVNNIGFKASIIIWDYAKKSIYAELMLHKGKVEALAFSPNEKYLVSLGGKDDDSIVVWKIETKQAICGSTASAYVAGYCLALQYSHHNDNVFVSAGSGTLRVWELDFANGNIRFTECKTGKLQRNVNCIEISEDDQFIFCGTTSGDIMKINLKEGLLVDCGPVKTKYSLGVNVIRMLKSGDLLVGSGSGAFTLCSRTNFKIHKKVQLEKGVTSISLRKEGQQFFVGTESAQIYCFSYDDFKPELFSTSHSSAVKDVVIPIHTSELFVTCSAEDIRVWHINNPKDLLRISVPNMTCNAVDIMADGHSFISAWNDDKIRVFEPEGGSIMLTIDNAHRMGVTAIAGTNDCKRIVSGGGDGGVHVWGLLPRGHRLQGIMRGHKATINCITVKSNDKECVTASSDGACIIWDIVRFVSLQMVLANAMFQTVCYHPEESQIITSGTGRKVAYWDVFDGSAIRELECSDSGAINGMHISKDGRHFVTGGDDMQLKVWDYMGGEVTHVGTIHGSSITSIKLCCFNKTLISTSRDGAIMVWKFPHPPSVSELAQ